MEASTLAAAALVRMGATGALHWTTGTAGDAGRTPPGGEASG